MKSLHAALPCPLLERADGKHQALGGVVKFSVDTFVVLLEDDLAEWLAQCFSRFRLAICNARATSAARARTRERIAGR